MCFEVALASADVFIGGGTSGVEQPAARLPTLAQNSGALTIQEISEAIRAKRLRQAR